MGMRILLLPDAHKDVTCGLSHPTIHFSTNIHPVYGSKRKYERKSKNEGEKFKWKWDFFKL
jgi:hypothetical protein